MRFDFYHVIRTNDVAIGQPLQVRFANREIDAKAYEALQSAWREPDKHAIIKSLILNDYTLMPKPGISMYLKEFIFELVRASIFPNRPSRFESIYLFASLDHAFRFQDEQQRLGIFRCEVKGGSLTALDMTIAGQCAIPLDPIQEQIEQLTHRAYDYWSGAISDNPCLEILVTGGTVMPLEIVG